MFIIKKGLNLPIKGAPSETVVDSAGMLSGILGDDFPGLKPSLLVKEGDVVRKGQPVITDRKNPSFLCTAAVSGVVKQVNRGEKRRFLSLVIEKQDGGAVQFDTKISDRESVLKLLHDSGLLAYFVQRPFAVSASLEKLPEAVFVNCMDTRPLAPDMSVLLKGNEDYLFKGLEAVSKIAPSTYVCKDDELTVKVPDGVRAEVFKGKHPAGLAGTHVHFLRPASLHRTVWTADMQTIIDLGFLITHNELNEDRIIAVAGPAVKEPCHMKILKGASIDGFLNGRLKDGENRIINGSALYGFPVNDATGYVSQRFGQISVINEQTDRPFMGWLMPGAKTFSVKNIFLSKMSGDRNAEFDTSLNGCERPMVPVGTYEKVMPLDILPTHLLRALLVKDYETAEKLGCLELSEEDLSLCTYVCPGKIDYAPVLRSALTEIEKEG